MKLAVILLIVFGVVLVPIVINTRRAMRAGPKSPAPAGPPLREGDRVVVSGGYDSADWLVGGEGYAGTLERFIPGQNQEPAAVMRTDEVIAFGGVTGRVLVLELRWAGATWNSGAVAHVELCDFEPEAKPALERRRGAWVESHATVQHLDRADEDRL